MGCFEEICLGRGKGLGLGNLRIEMGQWDRSKKPLFSPGPKETEACPEEIAEGRVNLLVNSQQEERRSSASDSCCWSERGGAKIDSPLASQLRICGSLPRGGSGEL